MPVQCIDGPPASGKTHTTAERALENLKSGKKTLVLVPTHKVANEIISMMRMISKDGLGDGYIIQLVGKTEKTCGKEKESNCSKCNLNDKHSTKEEKAEIYIPDAKGKIVDTKEIVKMYNKHPSCCPVIISRALASSSVVTAIVIAVHAYLCSAPAMDILEEVEPEEIIVDEGDMLMDSLLSASQMKMDFMLPRQNKLYAVRDECNEKCLGCTPHFIDHVFKTVYPYQGKIANKSDTTGISTFIEIVDKLCETIERAVENGIIKNVFNFNGIKEFSNRLKGIFPKYEDGMTTFKYLEKTEEYNRKKLIPLDDRDDCTQFAIPISVPSVTNNDFDEIVGRIDYMNSWMLLSKLKKEVFVTPEDGKLSREMVRSLEPDLLPFLYLVNFLCWTDELYLFIEKKTNGSIVPSCKLTLRYLKRSQYVRAFNFLNNRAILVSGTFLDQKMIAAHFLRPSSDVQLDTFDTKYHKSALIIVHNNNFSFGDLKLEGFRHKDMANLYKSIEGVGELLNILHFEKNKKASQDFFRACSRDSQMNESFMVELREKDCVKHNLDSSYEDGTIKKSILAIDTIRSSTSRGANRDIFNLCVVFGNCIARWDDKLALFLEARKIHPEISISQFIQYEQKRAVVQALLRAPRSAKLTVCLYVGNLHSLAFPKYLQNRIVTTTDLVETAAEEQADNQIEVIKGAIEQFLRDGDIIVRRTMPSAESLIGNRWQGNKKHFQKRFDHIIQCIENKGHIDKVQDKKGKREIWDSTLEFLVENNYLQAKKEQRKTVYVRS